MRTLGQAAFLMCVSALMATALGGDSQNPAQPSPEEMAKYMARAMAAATPGENHKLLEQSAGKWDLTMKMWAMGPGGAPIETKGTSECRMVLGGRFLHQMVKSEMKMPGPDGKMMSMPFEGSGLTGYDNFRKCYTGMWADSMGTQLITMRGNYDPAKKTLTMYGEMDDPALEQAGKMVKYVTKIVDEKTQVFEIYDLSVGAEGMKMMEITYTKQ